MTKCGKQNTTSPIEVVYWVCPYLGWCKGHLEMVGFWDGLLLSFPQYQPQLPPTCCVLLVMLRQGEVSLQGEENQSKSKIKWQPWIHQKILQQHLSWRCIIQNIQIPKNMEIGSTMIGDVRGPMGQCWDNAVPFSGLNQRMGLLLSVKKDLNNYPLVV